jgi:hypothetical protein
MFWSMEKKGWEKRNFRTKSMEGLTVFSPSLLDWLLDRVAIVRPKD